MHGDLASSNVLLTRRGARGVCERLGVGRLRAKVAFSMPHLARIAFPMPAWHPAIFPMPAWHPAPAASEFMPAHAPATAQPAWSIKKTSKTASACEQPDMHSNACAVHEHFLLRHMAKSAP